MGKTVNKSAPYKKVQFRGVTLDNRTLSALKWAEVRYAKAAPLKRRPFRLGQGSYSDGSMSAGTHSLGGAVDIMFAGVSARQRKGIVKWLRRAGFAAWRYPMTRARHQQIREQLAAISPPSASEQVSGRDH